MQNLNRALEKNDWKGNTEAWMKLDFLTYVTSVISTQLNEEEISRRQDIAWKTKLEEILQIPQPKNPNWKSENEEQRNSKQQQFEGLIWKYRLSESDNAEVMESRLSNAFVFWKQNISPKKQRL